MKKNFYVLAGSSLVVILLISFGFFSKSQSNADPSDLIQVESAMLKNFSFTQDQSYMLYNKIANWKKIYPEYDKLKFMKISEMQESVNDVGLLISEMRGNLIGEADHINNFIGDTLRLSLVKNPWHTDASNKILLDVPEKSRFSASVLKEKIIKAEELMRSADSLNDYIAQKIFIRFNENTTNGKKKTWEEISFRDRPLINTELTLTSLRMQLSQAEYLTLQIFVEQNHIK